MGYNPFRWYTQGKYRTKPLKKSEPLLLKIQNGDFEYSPFFLESKDNDKLYDEMFYTLKKCKTRRLAIDIGANSGLYSYFYSKHFNEIKSFEPFEFDQLRFVILRLLYLFLLYHHRTI